MSLYIRTQEPQVDNLGKKSEHEVECEYFRSECLSIDLMTGHVSTWPSKAI